MFKLIYLDSIIMSQLDLDLKNYDYYELLNLFKIDNNDNRTNVLYKIEKKLNYLIDKKLDDYILNFYKKAKNIIIVINDLLIKSSTVDIEPFMNKIYKIDKTDNIASFTAIDLLNKIKNVEIEDSIPLTNKNDNTYYNVDKMDYILKNTTNPVFNVGVNELTPGDLNSIKRITQLLNLNINSCFRNNYYHSNPTDFLYNLPVEIKNVSSMRLVSIEIPNSWYLFSQKKKNNIFYVLVDDKCKTAPKEYTIEIPDGNYNFENLENYLNTTYFYESGIDYPLKNLKFSINHNSLKSTFEVVDDHCEKDSYSFSLKFALDINQNIIHTAGWILGFRLANYLNINKTTSEGLFDAGGDRYIYLSINDFQYNNNASNIVCFDKNILNEDVIAKIPMDNGKLSLIINDNNNNLAKIRRYNGPINLSKIQIKLLDQFGCIIDLNNMDFSMTLELQILYENFNFKNITS
jgi:hypothetical protein